MGDFALGAPSVTFSGATPAALATALNGLSGPADGHTISLVLHQAQGALIGAVSATSTNMAGKDVFPANEVPSLMSVVPSFTGGFTSEGAPGHENDPQPRALLRFVDQAGPVSLEIGSVRWTATAPTQCPYASVEVEAVIPLSEAGFVLHLEGGDHPLDELAAGAFDGGTSPLGTALELPCPLHFTFQGSLVPFDFDTLANTQGSGGAGGGGGHP